MQLDPELEPHLVEASRLNNLDPNLLRALIAGESSSNPNTPPSTKGALGIAQFMPRTAAARGIDPHDPVQSIYGAADLLNENLTKAEQIRAGGRDINPTAHALRMYFAGDEGPQWKEQTANYPNLIWGRYKELAGSSYPKIGAPPAAEAPSSDTGDALRQQYDAARQRYAKGPDARGNPGESFEQYKARFGSGMNAIDALAATGQQPPPAQGDADPGIIRMAQLSAPNEDAAWQGFIRGDYDHLFKLPAAQPQPQAAPQSAGGQTVLGPEQLINLLNTSGQAKGGLAAVPGLIGGLETMIKNGTQFVRQPDGSIGINTIGGAPESVKTMEAAKAAGQGLLTQKPDGSYQNAPGVAEAAAAKAGGIKGAESVSELPAKATMNELETNNKIREDLAKNGFEIKNGVIVKTPNFDQAKAEQTGAVKGAEGMSAKGTEALDAAHQAELAANRRTQVYGQMAEAMQGFQPGATAEKKLATDRILKDILGVGLFKEGGGEVPAAEIFQQAGKHLQITAQPKGQGQVSNFERELFSQAVPNMTNSPEGLTKAIEIGKRLDDFDRQVAQIHRDVAKQNGGLPNYLEAQQRIATLGPPLAPGETAALERLKPKQDAAAQVPGLPDGAKQIGTYQGKPVYQMPDGSRKVAQ